jgi:hypothetical protein
VFVAAIIFTPMPSKKRNKKKTNARRKKANHGVKPNMGR